MKPPEAKSGGGWGFRIILICLVAAFFIPLLSWWKKSPPAAVDSVVAAPEGEPAEAGAPAEPVIQSRVEPPSAVEEKWGIQVSSVQLALSGYALDLRYKVVDPDKALALSSGETGIYVIDDATGTKLALPSLADVNKFPTRDRARMARQGGAFPPSPNSIAADRTNSVLLPNALQLVKSGSRITVFVGDARADNVIVQ